MGFPWRKGSRDHRDCEPYKSEACLDAVADKAFCSHLIRFPDLSGT